jgi:hypothetical protein
LTPEYGWKNANGTISSEEVSSRRTSKGYGRLRRLGVKYTVLDCVLQVKGAFLKGKDLHLGKPWIVE